MNYDDYVHKFFNECKKDLHYFHNHITLINKVKHKFSKMTLNQQALYADYITINLIKLHDADILYEHALYLSSLITDICRLGTNPFLIPNCAAIILALPEGDVIQHNLLKLHDKLLKNIP